MACALSSGSEPMQMRSKKTCAHPRGYAVNGQAECEINWGYGPSQIGDCDRLATLWWDLSVVAWCTRPKRNFRITSERSRTASGPMIYRWNPNRNEFKRPLSTKLHCIYQYIQYTDSVNCRPRPSGATMSRSHQRSKYRGLQTICRMAPMAKQIREWSPATNPKNVAASWGRQLTCQSKLPPCCCSKWRE